MKRFETLDETFVPRQESDQEAKDSPAPLTVIDIWIDKKEAYRIYDRFGEEEIEVLPDGNFMVHMHAEVDDWVYGVILGFGPSARVLAGRRSGGVSWIWPGSMRIARDEYERGNCG